MAAAYREFMGVPYRSNCIPHQRWLAFDLYEHCAPLVRLANEVEERNKDGTTAQAKGV
jgi:hypothetical protein